MDDRPNVLWIMADQLRYDYLSCYGHPHLSTPNVDGLAAEGVRFTNAYVQSPVCGPSRMSAYTGRYVRSHGSTWNGIPLRVGEPTLGDHLREAGVRTALVGKTHMVPDSAGMEWLGIDPVSEIGVRVSECGFDPYDRNDGLYPSGPRQEWMNYDDYLVSKGMASGNPWEDFANSAEQDGELLSGWLLRNSNLEANVPEEHSETAYSTTRAMEFMEEASADGSPWLCHLSYIKPHWPYIAPAPYHSMYGPGDVVPAVRRDREKDTDHPLFAAYISSRVCRSFSRDFVRERVIPAYMGLIKQVDDHVGRLLAWMEERGLARNTIVVFTSDHGDYLGDHWMGEKDFFHDAAAKVPLIIRDPRPEADGTRGTVCGELVEMIDLAPTFMAAQGVPAKPHIIEGRDLAPILRGTEGFSRRYAISEYDYCALEPAQTLGVPQEDARATMIRDKRWKYVRCEGFRPMLFDLESDPDEFDDLGASREPEHAAVMARMEEALLQWATRHHTRITADAERVRNVSSGIKDGILIGFWDDEEFEAVSGFPLESLKKKRRFSPRTSGSG